MMSTFPEDVFVRNTIATVARKIRNIVSRLGGWESRNKTMATNRGYSEYKSCPTPALILSKAA